MILKYFEEFHVTGCLQRLTDSCLQQDACTCSENITPLVSFTMHGPIVPDGTWPCLNRNSEVLDVSAMESTKSVSPVKSSKDYQPLPRSSFAHGKNVSRGRFSRGRRLKSLAG